MIVESLRWKYDVLSLLVHRRKISRDAHVQTSKRVRALGTTYIKRVLTSPSFFPTTTSFSQPVHQNKRSGSLCLFSLTSKILQRYYQFRVCFFFDQVHIYTQQNENHHNPCCVWPFDQLHIYLNILFSCQNRLHTSLGCQKAKEAFYMFVSLASKSPKMTSNVSSVFWTNCIYTPIFSLPPDLSRQIFFGDRSCLFLWPPRITMLLKDVGSAFFTKFAFLKTYVCLSKVLM